MAGIQKLVVFNLAIILPIFVLAAPKDGSSPDLDIMEDLEARAADISIFMDDEEIKEESRLGTDNLGLPIDPTTGSVNPGSLFQDPNAPRVSLKMFLFPLLSSEISWKLFDN